MIVRISIEKVLLQFCYFFHRYIIAIHVVVSISIARIRDLNSPYIDSFL